MPRKSLPPTVDESVRQLAAQYTIERCIQILEESQHGALILDRLAHGARPSTGGDSPSSRARRRQRLRAKAREMESVKPLQPAPSPAPAWPA